MRIAARMRSNVSAEDSGGWVLFSVVQRDMLVEGIPQPDTDAWRPLAEQARASSRRPKRRPTPLRKLCRSLATRDLSAGHRDQLWPDFRAYRRAPGRDRRQGGQGRMDDQPRRLPNRPAHGHHGSCDRESIPQEGEQRNRGIEFNIAGGLIDGIRVLGGVSLLEGRRGRHDGNKAVRVPGYQLNLGLEWDTPFARGMTLSARVINTGKHFIDIAKFPGDRRLGAFRRMCPLCDRASGRQARHAALRR